MTYFLGTGLEKIVTIKDLIEDANLIIERDPKLDLVPHIGDRYPVIGVCQEFETGMMELKARHPIFGVKADDYDLILSQSFLNSIKFSQKYKSNWIFVLIVFLYTL